MSESKPTIAGFSVVSEQESPIRVAVIGTGHLGRIHARLLSQVAGAKLVAVCDVNEDACQAVASEHDVLAFQDVTSCLDQIDAAVVAAPTGCHPSIATTLIQAGKHVLVEKPLGLKASDFDDVIAARDASGLHVAEAYMVVHHPQWHKARALLRDGAVGELAQIDTVFSYNNAADTGNIRNRAETGGGAI
ncbi:MAG: Gfo/Idh/MocA family oxidoreductase, partial [Planctomycetota bacterium]